MTSRFMGLVKGTPQYQRHLEWNKKWYWEHPEQRREYSRNYYWTHRVGRLLYARKHGKSYRPVHRQKLKEAAIRHYSPEMNCVRCGFGDIRALSMDHINGGGGQHRRSIRKYGYGIYDWVIKNHFPPGFQVLCMNCQFIKRYEKREFG